jgi:hypothetical protein
MELKRLFETSPYVVRFFVPYAEKISYQRRESLITQGFEVK